MQCFRGFLRSDTLIGTANVKLQPLENTCEIHESFDVCSFIFIYLFVFQSKYTVEMKIICTVYIFIIQLMDGRKPVGGKLEVKIRIRNPILSKQVVTETEKWLIIELPH